MRSNILNIGYGCTFWFKHLEDERFDGIGVYSKNLYDNLQNRHNLKLHRITFLEGKRSTMPLDVQISRLKYAQHLLLNTLLKLEYGIPKEFTDSIDLFFASDHHIPIISKKPVVATVMDMISFSHPSWTSSNTVVRSMKNFLFKRLIESAHHIITISQYSKQDIMKYCRVKEEDISVVSLGVDRDFYTQICQNQKELVLKKYGLKKKILLSVGTLQPRKNYERMIEAYLKMDDSFQQKYQLVIVGKRGWKDEALVKELRRQQTRESIIWLEFIPKSDLIALIQSAEAMLYLSLYEGFGLPIVEAFASKCPVIASNVTSIPEVAKDCALLVDPYSLKEIQKALYRVEDKDLIEELKAKAYKRALEFSWKRAADEHQKVFEKIVSCK